MMLQIDYKVVSGGLGVIVAANSVSAITCTLVSLDAISAVTLHKFSTSKDSVSCEYSPTGRCEWEDHPSYTEHAQIGLLQGELMTVLEELLDDEP